MSDGVEVSVRPTGMGTVKVNGKDISDLVYRVEWTSEAGQLTDVTLHIRAVDVTAHADADPTVVVGGEKISGEDVSLLEVTARMLDPEHPTPSIGRLHDRIVRLHDLANRLEALLPAQEQRDE